MKKRYLIGSLWMLILGGWALDRSGLLPLKYRQFSAVSGFPSVLRLRHPVRVDGDTLRLEDGRKLRLVGIDTPEWDEVGGDTAKAFLDRHLAAARSVTATICPEKRFDRYGRLLGSLFIDGKDFQEMALRAGVARSLTIAPCGIASAEHYTTLFIDAFRNHIGTWRSSPSVSACEAGSLAGRVVAVRGRMVRRRISGSGIRFYLGASEHTCLQGRVYAGMKAAWCDAGWCDDTIAPGACVEFTGKIRKKKGRPVMSLGHPLEGRVLDAGSCQR